jgi:hypothetical protein
VPDEHVDENVGDGGRLEGDARWREEMVVGGIVYEVVLFEAKVCVVVGWTWTKSSVEGDSVQALNPTSPSVRYFEGHHRSRLYRKEQKQMSLQQICSERRCENDKCVLRIAEVYHRGSGSPARILSHQSCSPMARSVPASDLAQRLVELGWNVMSKHTLCLWTVNRLVE